MGLKFFSVKNKTDTSADVYFYGDIVSDSWAKWSREDTCPQDIIDLLKECEGVSELNIFINSGGGNVWAGIAIYNILKRFSAHKTVHVDGLAASIASVIALAGDEIIIPANAFMMIHKAWTIASGNADELRTLAEQLDTIEQSIVNVYVANAAEGVTEERIKELMQAETWLDATAASELFKNITVAEEIEAVNCISDFTFGKLPTGVTVKNRAKVEPPQSNPPTPEPKAEGKITEQAKKTLESLKNFVFVEEETV